MSYKVERYDPQLHLREGFECEEPQLSNYLKRQLNQDEKRGLAKCFVLVEDKVGKKPVLGFYTLSSFAVTLSDEALLQYREQALHKGFAKIDSYKPIPCVLIGRLARDRSLKGTVAGERLLVDALLNILQASNYIAVHFVVVDAKNDYAKAFYQKFGFIEFGSLNNRMYLPMGTLKQALSNRSAD